MLVGYDRARGAIHSLSHLESLSDQRCRILCVSDRTLYLLHNYAAADVSFQARYAEEKLENFYIPVERDSVGYELFESVSNRFKLEVIDMTCDIQTGLEAIADAIRVGGGGGCASYGNVTLNCIVDLTDDQLLGPGAESQGNPVSDPPPDGFETWSEYFAYKCQAAHFIWEFQRKNMVAIRNFEGIALSATIAGPVIAGIAGVLPAAFTPAGFVVFIGSIVAIGIVAAASWVYIDEMIEQWDTDKEHIICALYNSGSSVEAVSALANGIEDAIQAIVSWGVLAPVSGEIAGLLGTMFSQLQGNGMVEPLFKAVAAVVSTSETVDCDTCGGGYPYAQTQQFSPYNVMTQGDDIESSEDDSVKGFKGTNSDQHVDLEFHVDGGYTGLWEWSCEYQSGPGDPQTCVVQLQYWNGSAWEIPTGGEWLKSITSSAWQTISQSDIDIDFGDAAQYRIHIAPQDFNESGWVRKFDLRPQ